MADTVSQIPVFFKKILEKPAENTFEEKRIYSRHENRFVSRKLSTSLNRVLYPPESL